MEDGPAAPAQARKHYPEFGIEALQWMIPSTCRGGRLHRYGTPAPAYNRRQSSREKGGHVKHVRRRRGAAVRDRPAQRDGHARVCVAKVAPHQAHEVGKRPVEEM